ncbi:MULTISPECIES: hypothetical protein [Nocardia]|uniref:hypothetical protein n=1 Tax=Nocardia TaxID=1817 RepID=UPI001C4FFA02|nr:MULTISPECIES: hypothetical protein [Nocardia]
MSRRVHGRRRPPVRSKWEQRGPGHVRPTVHPTPASVGDKPCGGVMCVPVQEPDQRR